VIAGTVAEPFAFFVRTETRGEKMPLLFYFPLIVWMGMMEVVQQEVRAPVKIKAQPPQR
jgi:hypothetical protein